MCVYVCMWVDGRVAVSKVTGASACGAARTSRTDRLERASEVIVGLLVLARERPVAE
jgi:hypothetical protein